MPRRNRRKTKGGGWFGADETGPGPVGSLKSKLPSWLGGPSAPTSAPAPAPAIIQQPLDEGVEMAQTAGKRIKKHIGFNPTSSKDTRRLFKTAKGDRMLGGRRRKQTRKHRR
jgi:hypothetical protein